MGDRLMTSGRRVRITEHDERWQIDLSRSRCGLNRNKCHRKIEGDRGQKWILTWGGEIGKIPKIIKNRPNWPVTLSAPYNPSVQIQGVYQRRQSLCNYFHHSIFQLQTVILFISIGIICQQNLLACRRIMETGTGLWLKHQSHVNAGGSAIHANCQTRFFNSP